MPATHPIVASVNAGEEIDMAIAMLLDADESLQRGNPRPAMALAPIPDIIANDPRYACPVRRIRSLQSINADMRANDRPHRSNHPRRRPREDNEDGDSGSRQRLILRLSQETRSIIAARQQAELPFLHMMHRMIDMEESAMDRERRVHSQLYRLLMYIHNAC